MNTPLSARELHLKRGERTVLEQVNVAFHPGQCTALLGSNGAGKSSLLEALAGLLTPAQGAVYLGTDPISTLPPQQRAQRLAFLPQQAQCDWPISVWHLVALGRHPHGDAESEEGHHRVLCALRDTDTLHLLHQPVNQLSGGERMRVMLARMLAVHADILVLDEPVTGLDPQHQLAFMHLCRNIATQGKTVIVALHDILLAQRFFDNTLLLGKQRILAQGPTAEVVSAASIRATFGLGVAPLQHEGEHFMLPWHFLDERHPDETQ